MGVVDTLTDRNDQFSREQFQAGMPLLPALRTLVLCCVDPRVDPASVLGIELGEAAILRNIGGRITPHVIGEITALRQLTEVIVGPLAPMQDLIVLQHNDCGILRLQEPPEVLANFFSVEAGALGDKHIADPTAAVATDIGLLRDDPYLAATFRVTGMVYDVDTGTVEIITR